MEVTLLGSGSADRWPNAFCRCASCDAQRAGGVLRATTSALVDGRLLLDLGPDTVAQASRAGADLRDVHAVLVTHVHPDHWAPEALLGRLWARPDQPLVVAGPDRVIDDLERWYGGEPTLAGRRLRPGHASDIAGYRVRALAATHEVDTLLYDITDADGISVLYATDTAMPPPETLTAMQGRGYDLVLIEQTFGPHTNHGTGHLDFTTFASLLGEMRRLEAVTESTTCMAIHLSHHNPPEAELARTLRRWGATPGRDGQTWSGGPQAQATRPDDAAAPPRRTLLLGGVRSGKSALAERLLADEAEVVYVATAREHPDDADWQHRIATHQRRRPAHWSTEATTDLVGLLATPGPAVLIDCLTLWLTAQLDDLDAWDEQVWRSDGERRLQQRMEQLAAAWRTTSRRVVAVTNEVGSGIVPDTWAGRLFRDEMGRLNARIAAESDAVSLVVAGLETRLR